MSGCLLWGLFCAGLGAFLWGLCVSSAAAFQHQTWALRPQNIDLFQDSERYKVWGIVGLSNSWICYRGSGWIEHRTRKIMYSFPRVNYFQIYSMKHSVKTSKGSLSVLDSGWAGEPSLLYQIWVNTAFLRNTQLI